MRIMNIRIINENELKNGEIPLNSFITGDALRVLKKLPSRFVNLVITSPPYWQKRDYEHPEQIGLEEHFEEYVKKLVEIFKEVYRVLRDDGCVYLNIDDTYFGGGHGGSRKNILEDPKFGLGRNYVPKVKWNFKKYRRKSLCLIPFRLIIRLVDEVGFILRNVIIWYKTNPMPESVKDRFSHKFEYIFFLTKSEKYYFNLDNVREPYKQESLERIRRFLDLYSKTGKTYRDSKYLKTSYETLSNVGVVSGRSILKILQKNTELTKGEKYAIEKPNENKMRGLHLARALGLKDIEYLNVNPFGKNPGDVWEFTTSNYKGTHFAVFPLELPIRCILASCPPKGIVMDPFSGVGTVALACVLLNYKWFDVIEEECSFPINRNVKETDWDLKFIMIDIKEEYHKMALERIKPYIRHEKSLLDFITTK